MATDRSPTDAPLLAVLERARAVGFLGPGPLRVHLDHAEEFRRALPAGAARLVDLGSGGGVPALPLLTGEPDLEGILVESMQKRATFLAWAITELGLDGRVRVLPERAEVLAHRSALRGVADAVTARGFGPPALTAECAVGFLRVGGVLIVSEPPHESARWPADALAELGLGPAQRVGAVARMSLERLPDPGIPRSTRALVKRPRF